MSGGAAVEHWEGSGAGGNGAGARTRFPILVIGAGHAGCEAACIAAKMGVEVGLVTMSLDSIAHMPCNPAIGGLAKGHLVREIDALGGIMGRMADRAGIQFKMLNRGRGPAVWSPRAQEDKALYRAIVREHLGRTPAITLVQAQVVGLLVADGMVRGALTADGRTLEAQAIVVTPGTFLNGLLHIGDQSMPGGRVGEAPARGISVCLVDLGFSLVRLMTGRPPRIHRDSIDFSSFVEPPGDEEPDGERGIQEPAGDRHRRRDEHRQRDAVHQGDRRHADSRAGVGVGDDRPAAEEDEPERANELGHKPTRQ